MYWIIIIRLANAANIRLANYGIIESFSLIKLLTRRGRKIEKTDHFHTKLFMYK